MTLDSIREVARLLGVPTTKPFRQRIARADGILRQNKVIYRGQSPSILRYWVRSQYQNETYAVQISKTSNRHRCTCLDYLSGLEDFADSRRQPPVCKHIIAALMKAHGY